MADLREKPLILVLEDIAQGEVRIDTYLVDVEGFQNLANIVDIEFFGQGPLDDIEVFLSAFEAVENGLEEVLRFELAAAEKAELLGFEFVPGTFALDMLNPLSP